MLESHFIGIFPQLVEAVGTDLLIADIDTGIEPGKIDIDPPGVLWSGLKKAGILYDSRIYRVFESIRIALLVKGPVLMRGEIYLKISSSPGSIDTITGEK
jgi:hypothetical protein